MRLFLVFIFLPLISFAQLNAVDKSGKKQGLWKKMYSDGESILYEGQFKDDKPYGKFTFYTKEGKVNATIIHLSQEKSRAIFYHDNGEIMSEGIFMDKLKDSLWYSYTKAGELSSIEAYVKNKLNGVKLLFYLEGQENDKPKILRKEAYMDSLLHGACESFYSNGKIKQKGAYQLGIPTGTWEDFSLSGKVIKRYTYKNGMLHGWVYQYNESGNETNKRFFNKGSLLKDKDLEAYLRQCVEKGIDPEN